MACWSSNRERRSTSLDRAELTGKELRQQGIAVASLALLDADYHALTLDVRDLEADDIAATPVCDGKPRAVA